MNTVFSLFLFAVAIAYVEYRLKGIRRDTDNEQSGAMDFFATKKELKEAAKKLQRQADDDRQAINERMTSLEQKAFFTAEPKQAPPQQEEVVEQTDPSVAFFRWPADDGTFDDAQRQQQQTEDTYYLFRLDETGTKADFTFVTVSDTQLSKANNSSKKYIERACLFSGAKSMNYVCTPGMAHLERGRWIIDKKARIEYR